MVNKKIRESLNKAFLKVKLLRQDINKFKDNLEILLKITDKEISELLHIIGLTEVKQGSKKLIERLPENKRYQGSLLENTIYQLDTYNK
ncbi:hypothetical protein, partial [Geminocystis sp.]|uniref:type IIG restriction enzyme/methyltransferase n=1 Tax=Geminocystis sp. TaxID=2664100 RepID=UPI003593C41C